MAYELLDTFVELGGNFIQVSSGADLPSLSADSPIAESLVGGWLRDKSLCREDLVVSGRIRCPKEISGSSPAKSIRLQLEAILKRLGTEYLDIALLDWSHGRFPAPEARAVLEHLTDAGLLRHVGSIGFPCWRLAEWLGREAGPGRMRLESAHLDGPFTQCCLEDLAREHGVSLVVRWPFPGNYEPLFGVAREVFGQASFQVGIAWLLSGANVRAVQFSPKLTSEVSDAAEATGCAMSPDDRARVEAAYMQCALPPLCPRVDEFVCEPLP